MIFTSENIYSYCSRSDESSPLNPLEQLGHTTCLKQRVDIVLFCFADSQNNSQADQTIKVQTTHGSNVTVDDSGPVVNATTTFVSDSATVSANVSHSTGPTLGLAKKSQIPNVEDIKTFLAKPVVLRTGVFSTTDTYSTFSTGDAFYNFFQSAMSSNKISGFLGIRATIVLRIVVNANRFQQGRYMLCWIPAGGEALNSRNDAFIAAHTCTTTQRSQLHRVEIDLNCDTEAELVIPFTSSLNWMPTKFLTNPLSGAGSVGRFGIYPYVPLSAPTGSTTAGFKLYMHLEDVELFGAAVPQMGRKLSRVVKRNASEIEAKNANIGPVESAMNMGSQISNALSVIPVLTPFAKPASWVFDALSGVAASFGWSKPANLDQAKRVIMQNAPYMGSINNDDYSLPLSLDVKNYVEPVPLGITDVDEMDFLSICSIPTWIGTNTWNLSDAVGTRILFIDVTPSTGKVTTGSGAVHHTPLSFVSSYFNFWRGTLYLKLKLVKTEFHSGRIVICFSPEDQSNTTIPAPTYANSVYLQRSIYDIRECNEIVYELPYSSTLPYLNCSSGSGKGYRTGTLSIYVEDILTAPSAVSSSISIIAEMYAGDDIEFAYPVPQSWTPNYSVTPQMGEKLQRNDCRLDNNHTAMSHPHDSVQAASMCIGEKVRSFRSLIKAYNTINSVAAETPFGFWEIYPFNVPLRVDTGTPTEPVYLADLYGTLHGCFLYVRGGVRISVQDRDVLTDPAQKFSRGNITVVRMIENNSTNYVANGYDAPSGLIDRYTVGGLKVLGCNTDNQPVQVTVAALTQTVARLCNQQFVTSDAAYSQSTANWQYIGNKDVLRIGPTSSTAPFKRTLVKYRAGSDDCDFSYFISIMPMTSNLGV